jgi:NadR type nicotinamide-nucleotide adenylyltransferase
MSHGAYPLGLVVGKFAPLHRGHEWLVAQAAQQCDRLLVLSYTKPEFARCGPGLRRRWLAQRFPQHECHVIDDAWLAARCAVRGIAWQALPPNDAPDAVQQRWLAWLLCEVLQQAPDAMFASEPYVQACAQVLSEALGRPVQPVLVDAQRRHVPISAGAIRRDPVAGAEWLSPEVRASHVQRVLLLGGESSGKTTLAAALAAADGTAWVPEYGRELWEARGGRLVEADMLAIAREQVAREEQLALQARGRLYCDTSPLTTLGYSLWMFGRAEAALRELAQRPYDAIVLCAPDFGFVQDGTRRDEGFRFRQHDWYREELADRGWAWFEVSGGVDERVAQVKGWLAGL